MSALCRPLRSSTVPSTRCACSAASFGTSRVRMLRSMPSRCSNISALRCGRFDQRRAVVPRDAPRAVERRARQHRRAGAVAEQAGADQHAGVVVEVHRGAADLDADRQHVLGRARGQQRAAELQVGQGGRAALADQVVGLDVGAQAEALDDIAGQARAQVAGAGADDDRVDRGRLEPRGGQRARRCLGGERRRVREEAPVQRVGIDREDLVERVEREPARLDAVVALQDGAGDEVRARVEPPEPVGALEGRQAFGLGETRRGMSGADSAKVHAMPPFVEVNAVSRGLRKGDRWAGNRPRRRAGAAAPPPPSNQPATRRRAPSNIRIHGLRSLRSPEVQLICTLRKTRSGCGISAVKRPSAVVTPVRPPTLPFGLAG